jgi:hypothetical protein
MKTAKQPSEPAIQLLVDTLSTGSGVETCRGTKRLWGQLERSGLVTRQRYGGMMGHPFSYDLTDAGRAFIKHRQQLPTA